MKCFTAAIYGALIFSMTSLLFGVQPDRDQETRDSGWNDLSKEDKDSWRERCKDCD